MFQHRKMYKTHTLLEIGTQVTSPPWNQCSAKRQHSTNPLWSGNQRTSPPWNRCPILAEDTTVVATVAKNEKLHKINCKGWDKTRTSCTNTASHATHVLGCNQFKKFKQWKILQSMLLFSSTFFLLPLLSFQPRSNHVQHEQLRTTHATCTTHTSIVAIPSHSVFRMPGLWPANGDIKKKSLPQGPQPNTLFALFVLIDTPDTIHSSLPKSNARH